MRVRFHGAAGEVTGSCHEVEVGGRRLLLDCGLIQGSDEDEKRNFEPFAFDPASVDAVVLSHAHIDHCGRLPVLVKRGFTGPIWTQAATADLLKIMLDDSAFLAEMDAEFANKRNEDGHAKHKPLFTRADVGQVMRQVRALPYHAPTEILPGITLQLREAGHILGSATVELRARNGVDERVLVFSGDIGMKGTPILRDPEPVAQADLVLLEATYGGRAHRDRAATVTEIGEVLEHAWTDGGNLLIPAFAVGRTQEILYWFARYWDRWNLDRWKIFLDSPMASKVTEVYDRHVDLFDSKARDVWRGQPHPFRLPNLRYTESVEESRGINAHERGAIIIAGAGMCNGGRIRHHLRQNLGRRQAHLMFVGYQSRGTLGRRLVDGAPHVKMLGEEIQVNAQRHTVGGLSAHADQPGLLDWYSGFANKPPVVLVHGEDDAREALAGKLRERGTAVELARPGKEREV
jgi:metallo-beta-lactamase family protein